MPAPILGKTTPRIYTEPLAHHVNPLTGELLPDYTDGASCIAFATDVLGLTLFPWQEWLLNHALELNDDGFYRFRIIICMVARQNGKTTVENILALWHMYALESGLVIGTAQSLDRSEEAWKDCLALAELDDELNEMIEDRNFGHPKFFNLSNGCEYRVSAASRRGGRGFSGDLVLLDELREHQSFDSWSSVTNTMNARPFAQAWAFSNAGDALGVVLRYQRALAHRELGWPDGDDDADLLGTDTEIFKELDAADLPEGWDEITTGFFEWSAPPGAARSDMDALAQANPSVNHTEVTLNCPTTRTLLSALRSSPPLEYDMEVLCRFVALAEGGPFPEGSWQATMNAEATPGDDAEIVVCVEVSTRRDATFVARAGRYDKPDGSGDVAVVGISQDSPGTDWVVPYLVKNRNTYVGIVIRAEAGSPSLNLLEDIKNAKLDDGEDADLPVIEWTSGDVQAAHADMFDRLRDNRIEHLPHKGMDLAAISAIPLLNPGGGWRVDIRKSPSDTAPLLAAIGAVWGLDHLLEEISVYATQHVRVIKRQGF